MPLRPRVWELRDNMRPYDAADVALTEALDVDVVTVELVMSRVPAGRSLRGR